MTCFSKCAFWAGAILLVWAASMPARASETEAIGYNRDIRPILSDNCFYCHGPDAGHRKAKLRLDVRDEAIKKALIPGKPDESELVRRIFSTDEDEQMPPPKSEKKLTAAQKELLRRWIAEGAVYQKHWAYLPPMKPAAPEGSAAVDFLVRKRLRELGLSPSPEADRRTLSRRLYFDLVGLPPTPEEVEAFEHDTAPDAYEKLVEKLLASPCYGERMAIGWLDVVRYADTIGYHSDNPRNVWPYRDYVIQSFNDNKPFDQFTREQLAGDLLPDSTLEDKVASGFNRLLLSTEEGGAQPKDYEARMLTDRVRAIGTVWLAQTFGCCQCHDHKFDPILTKDFYSMGAFFADIKEPIIGRREDGMLVPTPDESAQLARLEQDESRSKKEFEQPRPEMLADWEKAAQQAVAQETYWSVVEPESAVAESSLKLKIESDGTIRAEKNPAHGTDTYRIKIRPDLTGIVGIRLEALASDKLPAHGPGRGKDGGFVLTELKIEDSDGNSVPIANASATWETREAPAWAAADEDVSPGNGWAVHGLSGVPESIYFALQEPVDASGAAELTLVIEQLAGQHQVLGNFRLAVTSQPGAVRAPETTLPPKEIAEILNLNDAKRTPEQESKLAEYHRSIAPELADLRQRLAKARKTKEDFEASLPHCLVSVSTDKPRTVRILPRGNWMVETGDIVEPALPQYLADSEPKIEGRRLTRLDLANWLVTRQNPLTARVFVNRLWKQFFGVGLSKVLDDFGAQGEPPPDQPLLDWLACEFMDSGWDVKHMVRLMVESQTYRQVSTASRSCRTAIPIIASSRARPDGGWTPS
jgi:hypothetical protein